MVLHDDFRADDLAAIQAAIDLLPGDIDKWIISIIQINSTTAEVRTGEQRGPLDGGGEMLLLKRSGPIWTIIRVGSWVS